MSLAGSTALTRRWVRPELLLGRIAPTVGRRDGRAAPNFWRDVLWPIRAALEGVAILDPLLQHASVFDPVLQNSSIFDRLRLPFDALPADETLADDGCPFCPDGRIDGGFQGAHQGDRPGDDDPHRDEQQGPACIVSDSFIVAPNFATLLQSLACLERNDNKLSLRRLGSGQRSRPAIRRAALVQPSRSARRWTASYACRFSPNILRGSLPSRHANERSHHNRTGPLDAEPQVRSCRPRRGCRAYCTRVSRPHRGASRRAAHYLPRTRAHNLTSVGKHHFSVNTPVEVDDPRYVSMLAANWFFRVEPEPVVSATADVIGCSEEAAPMEHQPMEPAPAPVEPAEAFEADPHPESYLLTDVITALDLADAQALDLLRVLDAPSQDAPVVRRTRRRKMPRCNARTRRGTACQCQAVPGKRRCRLHGGLSANGAKTLEGRARIADGQRRRWAAWRNERLGGGARCGLAAPDTRGASDH